MKEEESADGTVKLINLTNGKVLATLSIGRPKPVEHRVLTIPMIQIQISLCECLLCRIKVTMEDKIPQSYLQTTVPSVFLF